MTILEALNARYAVKKMTGRPVSDEKIETILEAIRLSAAGFGLQPYQIFVIKDAELKAKLSPAAFNQPQITGSSHLLVFTTWMEVTDQHVEDYMKLIAETRGVSLESLADFSKGIKGALVSKPVDQQQAWMAKQTYIAMGTALLAAAEQGVDSTPMEGFNPAAVDEVLGLNEKGLKSVLILALGEKDVEGDYLYGAKKVRKSKEDLFIRL